MKNLNTVTEKQIKIKCFNVFFSAKYMLQCQYNIFIYTCFNANVSFVSSGFVFIDTLVTFLFPIQGICNVYK